MPHVVIVDSETQCIFVRYEGKVTLAEILGVIDLLVEDPAYRAIHRRLHDYSRIDWQPSTEELRRLADHSRSLRGTLTRSDQELRRTAVLFGSDVDFGLGRMTQAFADPPRGPSSEFLVCRTYAEAANFLELPAADHDPFEQGPRGATPTDASEDADST